MLNRIRIILIKTSHPGNIGSAARAMKTMGLEKLYLVNPQHFPHDKAVEMSCGAADILDNAHCVATVKEAIANCTLVIGTTARLRTISWPLLAPREMAEKIKMEPLHSDIAILFGREQTGLTNEELELCNLCVQIPANPEYSSLNIAAAVQLICYELRLASSQELLVADRWDYRLANANEMEKFFVHLQEVLIEIDFLKMNAPRKLMTRLRRFFLRSRPDVMEMNIFRGLLSAVQEKRRKG
jgi:tRNA (cytidine32/uridine32-2'-O)-methyltransferase